jgi:spermidine synthase
MGATFSHLAQAAKRSHWGVGRALCLNTLGGALAPFLFGVLVLPSLGIVFALLLLPLGYICCLPRMHLNKFALFIILCISIEGYLAFQSDTPSIMLLAEGETTVHYQEGVMASVSVVKDNRDALHLKVNNHFQMGGTTSLFSDRRQAYLPLLLHPAPKNTLFLGLGTGATFAASGTFPETRAVGVELIPEVITAMQYFEESTGKLEENDHLHILNGDARRFVISTNDKYDVVIADLFHPARDGAGNLYTVEHFCAIANLLTEDGIFCQWLPLYQLDAEMFKVITRTFLEAFPNAQAYLAHYSIDQPIIGLVGGNKKLRFPEKWLEKRLKDKNLRRYMAGFGYDSIYSLLGTFIASEETLREYSRNSPLNTDNNPVVLFQAPRFVYTSHEPAHRQLLTLLAELPAPDPESILAETITEEDYLARSRLSNYWQARDSFLKLGTAIERTRNVNTLYETASDQLLDIVRKSLDFSAAYFPLISIAYTMYPLDQEKSYKLLRDLERANPLRPEAANLRQQLFVQNKN